MTYLPGNRVRLVADWAPEDWRDATGTVTECASSTLAGAPGMLYLVVWDAHADLVINRSVMRDEDLAPILVPIFTPPQPLNRNDLLALAEFGPVYDEMTGHEITWFPGQGE